MISEVCAYCKNWFTYYQPKIFEKVTIENGQFEQMSKIQTNQYYRIIGSVFNDGVYKRGSESLKDETFNGSIWLMAVPDDFLELVSEMEAWQEKYGSLDSENMSPYQSESFGGYSYNKGSSGSDGSTVPAVFGAFGARLRRYRKI